MRRPNIYRGSRLPQAKLTEDDVRDIREEVNRLRDPGGWMPRGEKKKLADDYCVSQRTIDNIRYGKAWTWMKEASE